MKSEHKRYFRSIIRHITPGIIVVSLVYIMCMYIVTIIIIIIWSWDSSGLIIRNFLIRYYASILWRSKVKLLIKFKHLRI